MSQEITQETAPSETGQAAEEGKLTRRRFLVSGTMAAGLVASTGVAGSFAWQFVYPTAAKVSTVQVLATSLSRLPPGSRLTRNLEGNEIILVNQDGRVRAFSTVCTHLGCRVTWQTNAQRFFCPCHSGVFDADGKVVSGPPPRPLDEFAVEVKGGSVYVTVPQAEGGT